MLCCAASATTDHLEVGCLFCVSRWKARISRRCNFEGYERVDGQGWWWQAYDEEDSASTARGSISIIKITVLLLLALLRLVVVKCGTTMNKLYLNLPKPSFLQVLIINPNMGFIGTLPKSRFW